jgi:hypothetical protein
MVPAFVKKPDEAWAKNEPVWTGIAPVVPIDSDSAGRETLRLRALAYAGLALAEVRALYHRACGRQSAPPRQLAAWPAVPKV